MISWDIIYEYALRLSGSQYWASDKAGEYGHLDEAVARAEVRRDWARLRSLDKLRP